MFQYDIPAIFKSESLFLAPTSPLERRGRRPLALMAGPTMSTKIGYFTSYDGNGERRRPISRDSPRSELFDNGLTVNTLSLARPTRWSTEHVFCRIALIKSTRGMCDVIASALGRQNVPRFPDPSHIPIERNFRPLRSLKEAQVKSLLPTPVGVADHLESWLRCLNASSCAMAL